MEKSSNRLDIVASESNIYKREEGEVGKGQKGVEKGRLLIAFLRRGFRRGGCPSGTNRSRRMLTWELRPRRPRRVLHTDLKPDMASVGRPNPSRRATAAADWLAWGRRGTSSSHFGLSRMRQLSRKISTTALPMTKRGASLIRESEVGGSIKSLAGPGRFNLPSAWAPNGQ